MPVSFILDRIRAVYLSLSLSLSLLFSFSLACSFFPNYLSPPLLSLLSFFPPPLSLSLSVSPSLPLLHFSFLSSFSFSVSFSLCLFCQSPLTLFSLFLSHFQLISLIFAWLLSPSLPSLSSLSLFLSLSLSLSAFSITLFPLTFFPFL